jgi:hypothetical protein
MADSLQCGWCGRLAGDDGRFDGEPQQLDYLRFSHTLCKRCLRYVRCVVGSGEGLDPPCAKLYPEQAARCLAARQFGASCIGTAPSRRDAGLIVSCGYCGVFAASRFQRREPVAA